MAWGVSYAGCDAQCDASQGQAGSLSGCLPESAASRPRADARGSLA